MYFTLQERCASERRTSSAHNCATAKTRLSIPFNRSKVIRQPVESSSSALSSVPSPTSITPGLTTKPSSSDTSKNITSIGHIESYKYVESNEFNNNNIYYTHIRLRDIALLIVISLHYGVIVLRTTTRYIRDNFSDTQTIQLSFPPRGTYKDEI